MISTALQEQYKVDIQRKKIVMPESAKTLGEYTLVLNLHKEVTVEMNMNLTDESGKTTVAEPEPAAKEEE
jgi:large subunit ribosomal protein L9